MSESRARLFLRLVLLTMLFAVPLAVLKPANDYVMTPKTAIAMLGAIAAAAILLQGDFLSRLRDQPVTIALVVWLALSVLSVPLATNRPQAIRFFGEQVGWAVLAGAALVGGPGLARCLLVCSAGLAVQVAIAVLQLGGHWVIGHGEQFGPGRVYATLGNPSFMGVYLAPLAVWFLLGIVKGAMCRSRLTLLWVAGLAAILYLLHRAEVKDAWAGLGVGGALGLALYVGRFRKALLAASAVLALTAGAALAIMASDPGRHLDYLKVKAFSWHAAARLAAENPLTGVGPGGFQTHAPRMMGVVHALWTKEWRIPENLVAPHDEAYAHQDFLQMLAESGVLGFGAWLTLLVVAARAASSRLPASGSGRPELAACLGSLAVFPFTASFHFPLHLASSALLFWFALGRSAYVRRLTLLAPLKLGFGSRSAAVVILFLASVLVSRGLTANVLLGEGYRLFRTGSPELAVPCFEKFERLDPHSYEERFYAGALYQALRQHLRAIESYERALELYPGMQGAYYNLGNLSFQRGDYARALGMFTRALELNPCMAEAANNRGNARAMLGDASGAYQDYLRAVELRQDYADALYNLAVNRHRAGRMNEARAWVGRALAGNPDHAGARDLAARLGTKPR